MDNLVVDSFETWALEQPNAIITEDHLKTEVNLICDAYAKYHTPADKIENLRKKLTNEFRGKTYQYVNTAVDIELNSLYTSMSGRYDDPDTETINLNETKKINDFLQPVSLEINDFIQPIMTCNDSKCATRYLEILNRMYMILDHKYTAFYSFLTSIEAQTPISELDPSIYPNFAELVPFAQLIKEMVSDIIISSNIDYYTKASTDNNIYTAVKILYECKIKLNKAITLFYNSKGITFRTESLNTPYEDMWSKILGFFENPKYYLPYLNKNKDKAKEIWIKITNLSL